MRLSQLAVILTFVLMCVQSFSAPNKALSKSRPSNADQNEFDENPGPTKKEPTSPTYPNLMEPSTLDLEKVQMTFNPRGKNDLNFYIGAIGGNILTNLYLDARQYFGFRYIPYETFEKAWDYSVDAYTEGLLGLSLGHRWHNKIDEHFDSYYRVSFTNFINSSEGLAGLINMRHMKVLVSFGVPNIFELQRQVHGEVGAGYGLGGVITYLQIGYNFNYF